VISGYWVKFVLGILLGGVIIAEGSELFLDRIGQQYRWYLTIYLFFLAILLYGINYYFKYIEYEDKKNRRKHK
jgi:hypothetical protein